MDALYHRPGDEIFDVLKFKDGRIFERYSKPQIVNRMSVGRVWSFRDVSAQSKAEEKLILASHVYENTAEGIIVTDANAVIESVNAAFTRITGYREAEAVGKNARLLQSKRQGPAFFKKMWQQILAEGSWQGEIWNKRKNGEVYPERLTISSVKNAEGEVTRYIAVFYDITDIKATEASIKHRAYHDPLTELPNRLLFRERLAQSIVYARRRKTILAVMFVDIDHFKKLNDQLGHYMGDLFLQEIGIQIKQCLREGDTVSRFGGDEFTLLIEDFGKPSHTSREDIVNVAQKVLDLFRKPFDLKGHEIHLSASIGISLYPGNGNNPELLVRNADMAMYYAKSQGRNNYKFFKRAMAIQAKMRVILENDLQKALAKKQFTIHYQPVIDLKNKNSIGLEALIRWNKPGVTQIDPSSFIPLAEECGLIVPMGAWLLRRACQQAAVWNAKESCAVSISVNLSARKFKEKDLVTTVKSALDQAGLNPKYLNLEITESAIMEDMDASIATLKRLKSMGVRISMDDFGTGYSSFTYLKRFPVDFLKLDTAFIRDIVDDADAAQLAAGIISLAKGLRLQVIAEGVETEAQLAFLKEQGCDKIQGFLFYKPMSEEAVTAFLENAES